MNKFTQIFKGRSGKAKLFIAAAAATISVAGGVVYAGYGPVRPTYDYNDPVDRKGSLVGPVFNSFLNTPLYGDERNFDRIAPVTAGQSPNVANYSEQTTAEGGKEYWVRTFVHNNANQSTNCLPIHKDATGNCTQVDADALGIAKNTRVRVAIADGLATGVDVMSYISADNAKDKNGTPQTTVYDSTTLVNPAERFSVSYVPGSAIIYNQAHQTALALPDAITSSTGTLIGFDQMNGNLPGCFEFSAYVYVKVKVNVPKLELVKQVRKAGTTDWKKSVDAKPGETVQWLVKVTNTGSARQTNVVASDLSPLHVTYVPGTAKWYNSLQPNGIAYDYNQFIIDNGNGGIIFGNYAANGGGFLVRFDTVIKDDFNSCAVNIVNKAHAKSDQQTQELTDTAGVTITKEKCNVTTPTYRCDLLTLTKLDDRKYSFKVDTTATNGAKVTNYVYDFGNGSTPLTTDKNVVEYTYPTNGNYTTKATVNFAVSNQNQSASSADCAKPITYTAIVTPPTPPPAVLPNTGAGSMVGIFAGVTVAAGLLHRFVLSRRFY